MNKKHIILNYGFIRLTCLFLIVVLISGYTLITHPNEGEERIISWVLLIFFSLASILCVVLFPHCCVIDEADITICYIFGLKESAEWHKIRKIYEGLYWRRSIIPRYNYRFIGLSGGKAFFMTGEFPKTNRLEKLLWQYAEKKIVPYNS